MTKAMIAIDSEIESLIPPLSEDEYKRLEKSILSEGVREPIITWNGTIIDGHNRYNICQEHGIEFKTAERKFASRDAAKIWIIENQFGRRNLSKYDRSVLALQLEPLYAAEAKRRQATSTGGSHPQLRQNSDEAVMPARTDEQLAKLAGTSRDTIRKVKVIEQEAAKGNETAIEARDAVKSGEKSINKAYGDIRPKICTVCGKPILDGDCYARDQNKHKACASTETELNRGKRGGRKANRVLTKPQFTDDGRRICSICGEPIDEGDAYDGHPSRHKRCHDKSLSSLQYKNPDKSLLENVPTYTIESLVGELMASAESMRSAFEESISINRSMGVNLTNSQRKQLDRAISHVFKTIQKIREGANNG